MDEIIILDHYEDAHDVLDPDDPYWNRRFNDTVFYGIAHYRCSVCGNEWSVSEYSCGETLNGNRCNCEGE